MQENYTKYHNPDLFPTLASEQSGNKRSKLERWIIVILLLIAISLVFTTIVQAAPTPPAPTTLKGTPFIVDSFANPSVIIVRFSDTSNGTTCYAIKFSSSVAISCVKR